MGGNRIGYYTAEGGVVIQGGKATKYGMCVMPPAQAVRERTGSGSGKINVKGAQQVEIGAEVSAETQHKVDRLYDQTSATIFLQHGLYRICEMAANGAFAKTGKEGEEDIDAVQYQEMVRQVLQQSYDLILAEAELTRTRQLEAAKELADAATPEGAASANLILRAFTDVEERTNEALKKIGAAKTEAELEPYLDDSEPRIRRAANHKLWRMQRNKPPARP